MTVSRTVHSMAMPFEVVVDAADPAAAEAAIDAFHAVLVRADETFSLYKPESPLSRLARGEVAVDDCPPEVAEVLDLCARYRDETRGAFDARRPDGTVDPTGIVKMWAVARGAVHLDAVADDWFVGAAGDVLVRGAMREVGIANPRHQGDLHAASVVDVVRVGGAWGALATSGGAQVADHIWDPATGAVARHFMQASVVGEDPVGADAWATAVCAGGPATAREAAAAGYEVLVIVGGRYDGGFDAQSSAGWPSALA